MFRSHTWVHFFFLYSSFFTSSPFLLAFSSSILSLNTPYHFHLLHPDLNHFLLWPGLLQKGFGGWFPLCSCSCPLAILHKKAKVMVSKCKVVLSLPCSKPCRSFWSYLSKSQSSQWLTPWAPFLLYCSSFIAIQPHSLLAFLDHAKPTPASGPRPGHWFPLNHSFTAA